jgi:hypothetical protein
MLEGADSSLLCFIASFQFAIRTYAMDIYKVVFRFVFMTKVTSWHFVSKDCRYKNVSAFIDGIKVFYE